MLFRVHYSPRDHGPIQREILNATDVAVAYHVKLEMLIAHMLPLSCYRKKLQNLSHLNCGHQIRQI